jgi:proline iminopeptidase
VAVAREELVSVPGGRLWTASSGAGSALLLCHGGPGGYDYLEPVAALIDDTAAVHRFDQRGGGRSLPDGPHTIARLIADMELLRAHWGQERWLVGGHSWGAHLALFYALAHPDRTCGLILLNGTGVRWGWGAARRADRLPRLTSQERSEVEELERQLALRPNERARSRLRDLMWLTDFADRQKAELSPRFADHPTAAAVVASLEQDWQFALEGIDERLGRLTAPALVLHGEADPIGEAGPRELAALLPQGRFARLPAVGHVPWLEDAGELRQELRDFIQAAQPD